MRKLLCGPAAAGALLLVASAAWGGDEKGPSAEEMAIQAKAKAVIAAFNRGDAAALAAFWTKTGDYMDEGGKRYHGRKAIEGYFAKLFAAGKGAKTRIHRTSLQVVRPDLAIADGIIEVFPPGGGPSTSSRYTAVQVKRGGKWYFQSVREATVTPPTQAEKLDDVAWLVGDWAEEGEKGGKGGQTHMSFSWAENNNFLVNHFATTLEDVPVAGGTQWIAWDPAVRSIRAWVFDSTGSITEATWKRDGDRLVSKARTILSNGKISTSVNVVTRIDADHVTVQFTQRTLDGKPLRDSKVVKLARVR
jgi:uncharacterized protein (TIGR02246 family)